MGEIPQMPGAIALLHRWVPVSDLTLSQKIHSEREEIRPSGVLTTGKLNSNEV
jgi:hypothetical protein